MRALLFLFLIACGGRIDSPGANANDAAPTNDDVPCGPSTCSASTQFCSATYADGGTTQACSDFPAKCHACACMPTAKIGFICTCLGDGDEITLSCQKE